MTRAAAAAAPPEPATTDAASLRPRRGRPAVNDASGLVLMARFQLAAIQRGEPPNDRAAARFAVAALGLVGLYAAAIEDRLRRKFRYNRADLIAAASRSDF